jgi:diphthine synthase
MSKFDLKKFESLTNKKIEILSRRFLEEKNGEIILNRAKRGKVAFLVPGDPLISTTHIDLRIRAEKRGIETRVIHNASIISAAIGLSGLQNYRFGKSVTIPFIESGVLSETPYRTIAENKQRNLHTLCFLDINVEKNRFMTINEALEQILLVEAEKRCNVVTANTFVVGIVQAGGDNVKVKAGKINELLIYKFGKPPQVLIFPSNTLHFMEAEALQIFANAPKSIINMIR